MNAFKLSRISEMNLKQVHPDLVWIVNRTLELSALDIRVIEGRRSEERQRQLVRNGHSRTLNSRHLTGHAVDVVPWIKSQIPWQDWQAFTCVAQSMKKAANEKHIPLVWGGDWPHFRDGSHYELSWQYYPL